MKDGINKEEKRKIKFRDYLTFEDISKDEPDMVEKLLEDIEDSEFLQDNNK